MTDNSGIIKVVVGNFEDLDSKIPNYSEQFLYHIHLEAGKKFSFQIKNKIEVAAFLPTQNAIINEVEFPKGEFIEFDRNAGEIEIKNSSKNTIDIMLFGGEKYDEPIVAEGPFVMNSQEEIIGAYRDFYAGK